MSAEIVLVGLAKAVSAEQAALVKAALEAKLPGREVVVIGDCNAIALLDRRWVVER